MKKVTYSFLLIALAFYSCNASKEPIVLSSQDTIFNDVSFDPGVLQKMDVYLPKNRSEATKTVIYIHGGGWYLGDKGEIKEGAVYFLQQGFAFISLN